MSDDDEVILTGICEQLGADDIEDIALSDLAFLDPQERDVLLRMLDYDALY